MSHFSTLRPLPQRLLERLWLILSGYVPISIEYPMTLGALNDDCLLILLDTLSMSQLLQLRGVSRRLCQLIERHCLRKFKSLCFASREEIYKDQTGEDTIRLHYAGRFDGYGNFNSRACFVKLEAKPKLGEKPKLPACMYVPLRTRAWPLSLPRLLPNLLCLSLEHVLLDQLKAPTEEHLAINRLLVPYLNSNWSRTLTTLFLYIHVPARPQSDSESFAQLNQLTTLKHLILDFLSLPKPESASFLLPDSMPLFGQLQTFIFSNYAGTNTAILLNQLGPDLSILILYKVTCSEDDCIAFLRARPNYAQTLRTFGVSLKTMRWELFTVATQNLSSLVEFQYVPNLRPRTELDSILTDLTHLPNLQYIRYVPLFVDQLRLLLLRQHWPWPGVLPRLTSIRQAGIVINNREENGDPFEPSELFDQLLPLLPRVFCRLDRLDIYFYQGLGRRRDEALSGQFSTKLGELFPAVRSIKAGYYV